MESSRPRRKLLAFAAAALGLAGTETVLTARPARANTGESMTLGETNTAQSGTILNAGGLTSGDAAFSVLAGQSIGILGWSSQGPGVFASSLNAVGLEAQSGFSTGLYASTRNVAPPTPLGSDGVRGVTPSNAPTDSGVRGEATAGAAGVTGQSYSSGPGVIGRSAAGDGVKGITGSKGITGGAGVAGANTGPGPGVAGSSVGGPGVHGIAVSGGIGVLASIVTTDCIALQVNGRAAFQRSGIVTITGPASSATVTPPAGLTSAALVLAVVQNAVPGVWVASAVPAPVTGTVTLNLNVAPPAGQTAHVAWFVVN